MPDAEMHDKIAEGPGKGSVVWVFGKCVYKREGGGREEKCVCVCVCVCVISVQGQSVLTGGKTQETS